MCAYSSFIFKKFLPQVILSASGRPTGKTNIYKDATLAWPSYHTESLYRDHYILLLNTFSHRNKYVFSSLTGNRMFINKKKDILVLVCIFIAKYVMKTQDISANITPYSLSILLEASMASK